ncbi:GNAT family N-acetyltransferase [Paraglaciecola arctica]|uniref:Phosphinothricin acetyltransferase n=1 Tax=Paraglaciecola arctica BSs20135 TaxID=493475 RepID=K6YXJ7_9ALTE|nr:GNAT family N-acetyltransferase [Paraglaciecola arctica]GAC21478.1 phosphinothricin acetyltransferase [Paraglaciecola arctica BSs20135]
MLVRTISDEDVNSITEIYNYYISETLATFETEIIIPNDMSERISKVKSNNLPWIVAEDDFGHVIGYAYATKWRERFAYRFSVEITVYLSATSTNKGAGTSLYKALFAELKLRNMHSVIGGITLPNAASVALHEKFGMVKVAHFKEVGFKNNQWLDVGYWQGAIPH